MTLLILVIVLILGSAFCSSSEAALFSVPKLKIETEAVSGNPRAKQLLKIKNNLGPAISAIVVMNNIFNIVGSIIIGNVAGRMFDSLWVGIFSAGFTLLIILAGEIIPKNFGEKYALSYAMLVAPGVSLFTTLLSPLLWFLDRVNKFILGSRVDESVSEDEIKTLISLGFQQNQIHKDEKKLIENVFGLNDKEARDIMTPRVHLSALDAATSLEDNLESITSDQHSRLPVYQENLDNIIGYTLLRDLLEALAQDKQAAKVKEFVQPILKVSETTKANSLLIFFQRRKTHIALVVDEFGGTSGLVTLEDVLEELVGEIVDETDDVVDMRNPGNAY